MKEPVKIELFNEFFKYKELLHLALLKLTFQ